MIDDRRRQETRRAQIADHPAASEESCKAGHAEQCPAEPKQQAGACFAGRVDLLLGPSGEVVRSHQHTDLQGSGYSFSSTLSQQSWGGWGWLVKTGEALTKRPHTMMAEAVELAQPLPSSSPAATRSSGRASVF